MTSSSYFDKMNSTLGSGVPLAMFMIQWPTLSGTDLAAMDGQTPAKACLIQSMVVLITNKDKNNHHQ